MSRRWDWLQDALTVGLLFVILVAVIMGGFKFLSIGMMLWEGNRICANAGYLEARMMGGEIYCVSFKDGTSVVISAEEIGR